MTVTLKLKPEVEAGLLARAQASGMLLEQFLLFLVENAAQSTAGNTAREQPARGEAIRRMVEFGEKHRLSLGEPITRDLLHEGHRF